MSGVPEFLVSRGLAAALARCRDSAGLRPARGETVVIRAGRGLELAEVLCEAPAAADDAAGDVVRRATADDYRRAAELRDRGQVLLECLHRVIDEQKLPLLPLDIDLTLDAERADVHVLCWGACTLTPIREDLKREHGVEVFFLDRSKPREHGCGSCGEGGCGEGGCGEGGCSTGGCSRGRADAAELTRYFASLREQMLASQRLPLA